MARVTRSKKVHVVEDNTAQPLSPQNVDFQLQLQQPTTLTEINNTFPLMSNDTAVAAEVEGLKAAYRNAIGTGNVKYEKKGKGRKKGKQAHLANAEQNFNNSDTADINSDGPVNTTTEVNQEVKVLALEEQKSRPSVRTTRKQAARQAAEEALSKSVINDISESPHNASNDFTESSKATKDTSEQPTPVRTLSHSKTLEEVEVCETNLATSNVTVTKADDDDSFIQEIIARSPAKPVSRIEDSVEALDQLEEALEALDEAALAERMISPEKSRKVASQQTSTRIIEKSVGKRSSSTIAAKLGHASVKAKSSAPKQAVVKKSVSMVLQPTTHKIVEDSKTSEPTIRTITKRPKSQIIQQEPKKCVTTKRPTSLILPTGAVKSTKPPTKPDFELPGEAIARKLKEKREARIAQRHPLEEKAQTSPIAASKPKSTKPLTKPSFELPGEVLSRRKKEEQESRLKAREEEEMKRREFKARPVRPNALPGYVPRETAASKARQSKVSMDTEDTSLTVSKRGSNISTNRPSINQLNLANTSAPRAPGPITTRKPSPIITQKPTNPLPQHLQRTVSASEVHIQRQRGKEIYNRDARMVEEMEREKRDREAAAKRAREEAAERGRQASREWAEKQLAKRMVSADIVTGVGFGPGGQLGLKA